MKAFTFIILFLTISFSYNTTIEEVMNYVATTINSNVQIKNIKVWAGPNYWVHTLFLSVSKYLFEDIEMVEHIAPEGNPNRPGTKYPKKYITVHDTGDFAFNAQQWSQAVYDAKIGDNPYEVSYQYVVGNDGYYHNIPDDETAYHAGDGAQEASLFQEIPTGVYGDRKNPHISISTDGFYVIEGEKTTVEAPTDDDGRILNENYFVDHGLYTTVKEDGQYYIGSTWYSSTYNRIGNHGGNTNSIGIESCVNKGSDIYFTIQRLAKLVADLMDKYSFTMDDIVQHHYYSGKDCPQTMRTEGYWEHFLELVKVEYQMLQYKKEGFSFELIPITKDYVNEKGRVLNRGNYVSLKAIYKIKVKDSAGNELEKQFSSYL